jgi:hypothetical protein
VVELEAIRTATTEVFIRVLTILAMKVPERHKHAVRSFGLFAPRTIGDSSAAVSAILGQGPKRRPRPVSWGLSIKRDFGWDPLLDRQGNRMTWTRRIAPQRA